VVTDDGSIYSYILKYAKTLPKLNHFVPKSASIGTEMPVIEKPKPGKKELDSVARRLEYFKHFGDYLLKSKPKNLKTKRKNGLKLQLQRIVYNGSETYLVMEVSNTSGIAFEIDFLNVYRVNGNKKRKASYQKLEMKPICAYKIPSKVYNSQSFRFVYVLPKFVLRDKEKLQLELQEINGSRKLLLKYH